MLQCSMQSERGAETVAESGLVEAHVRVHQAEDRVHVLRWRRLARHRLDDHRKLFLRHRRVLPPLPPLRAAPRRVVHSPAAVLAETQPYLLAFRGLELGRLGGGLGLRCIGFRGGGFLQPPLLLGKVQLLLRSRESVTCAQAIAGKRGAVTDNRTCGA